MSVNWAEAEVALRAYNKRFGKVEIYDTATHRIFGIAQVQSSGQTLTFSSQEGLVRLSDLAKVAE